MELLLLLLLLEAGPDDNLHGHSYKRLFETSLCHGITRASSTIASVKPSRFSSILDSFCFKTLNIDTGFPQVMTTFDAQCSPFVRHDTRPRRTVMLPCSSIAVPRGKRFYRTTGVVWKSCPCCLNIEIANLLQRWSMEKPN